MSLFLEPAGWLSHKAESDDIVSTDTGSDHQSNFSQPVVAECAPVPIDAKTDSSMRYALCPAPGTWTEFSPQQQQKKSSNKIKKVAPATNPGKLPSKKQLRRGRNVHQVSTLRSTLRNKGNDVMTQMSAPGRQPGVTEAAWSAGAASMPFSPHMERRPLPVPNIYLPHQMADVGGYRHFAPAIPNYQLSVPSYCSVIRRARDDSVPSYSSAIRRADSVPSVPSAIRKVDTPSSEYSSAIREAGMPSSDLQLEPAYISVTGDQLAECLQDTGMCWIRL